MAAAVLMAAITATGAETDTPKIGEPVKLDTPVIFIGDSMMKMLGKGMEKAFKAKEVTPAESFSSLGSGLARPSVFNWPAKAKELCERVKPKTAFIALGTNDRQNLESRTGSMAVVGTDEWRVEYKCRIEELLDRGASRRPLHERRNPRRVDAYAADEVRRQRAARAARRRHRRRGCGRREVP